MAFLIQRNLAFRIASAVLSGVVARALVTALLASAACQAQNSGKIDLTQASLEDLMNVQVTSVSKKEQTLSRTGAAVFVITQEDIRRSGATNIPDLLRLAPGVDVARLNANRWAISIRGFNSVYANKVLLLIDGRSVYNSTSSSVFWDQEMVPLEDIDHIEIIRGPGGTVWGANAVNGVINIITLNTNATKGGLIRAGTGSEQTVDGLAQYGGGIGRRGAYRIFGSYFNIESALTASGQPAHDDWHGSQGGFRSDWRLASPDSLTVQGDFLETEAGQTVTDIVANALPLQGTFGDRMINTTGNILGRWNHTLAKGSDTSLQVFYDVNHRAARGQVDESHQTTDLDFQHHALIGSRNDLVWGLGYRFERSHLRPGYAVQVLPSRGSTSLFSTFVQDEVSLTDHVFLTIGSKFEHNAYTGFEYEPSAQFLWTVSDRHTLWASAARAIRQPSRVDFGLYNDAAILPLAGGGFGVLTLLGSPHVQAEQLKDYEAGYRTQLDKRLSFDVTGFWSFYRNLQTSEPAPPFFAANPGPPHLIVPLVFENKAHARTHGAEFFANWEVNRRWKLSPGYSWLHMSVVRDPSSRDSNIEQTPGNSPSGHFEIRSLFSLSRSVDWDTSLQHVSPLKNGNISSYARLDTRVGWRLGESTEISVVGQNLLRPAHFEFPDMFGIHGTQVERSVSGRVTWRF